MSSQRRIFEQPTAETQRVQRARVNPNEPMACPKCGSIFFIEVPAQIYTSGSYGFRSVSSSPMKAFVCLCGELQVPPGMNNRNPAGSERDLFAQSVATALACRAETGADATAKAYAGIHELKTLQGTVAALQTQVDQLSRIAPAPEISEATETGTLPRRGAVPEHPIVSRAAGHTGTRVKRVPHVAPDFRADNH
jgi:hypothetical protein